MSGDPFFMNDRKGTPNAQNTVEGLSMILPKLKAKPFIMSSSGPASAPNLIMKAPYFQGNRGVNFNYKFEPNKDFCFYIFVNNYKKEYVSLFCNRGVLKTNLLRYLTVFNCEI